MIIVSDTSPIINLAVVGQLNLLQQLYGEVIIPAAVYEEIVVIGAGLPGSREVQACGWIKPIKARNETAVASLKLELDPGEAEAIALAIELKADLLLLDERKGRTIAARLGVRSIGILGTLIEAKQNGYVPAIKPILDRLIHEAGFWLQRELYEHILSSADE